MTKLEEALEHIDNARRKGSKNACWNEAERASALAGVVVYGEPDRPKWPDLDRLKKDIQIALGIDTVVVTRHSGLVEWLTRQGITGTVITHASEADVRDKRVIGALPFHFAALAAEVVVVDLPLLRKDQRGPELTPAEMDAAGARLRTYRVIEV